jgi:hypothetical protein
MEPLENKRLTNAKPKSKNAASENLAFFLRSEKEIDVDLRQVITAWASLPLELRRAVIRMIDVSK